MARTKKVLVVANGNKSVEIKGQTEEKKAEVNKYINLIDKIKNSTDKKIQDIAFNEIALMLEPKINQISYRFTISGYSRMDIYQEALFALKFKAIKDYNPLKSNIAGQLSAFDNFAVLCINRHLSTKLKASYQNKNKVLNVAISLNQNRNDSNSGNQMEGHLSLADIIPKKELDILAKINVKEYRNTLFSKLFQKLSLFEKKVFLLYARGYSYEEMAAKMSKKCLSEEEMIKARKSIDNNLSRIKQKSKEIFAKYGEKYD